MNGLSSNKVGGVATLAGSSWKDGPRECVLALTLLVRTGRTAKEKLTNKPVRTKGRPVSH